MNTMKKVLIASGTALASVLPSVHATSILANDSFDFLPGMGSAIGNFMTNITPGLVGLIIVLAIVGAVVGIILAVAYLVKHGVTGGGKHFK